VSEKDIIFLIGGVMGLIGGYVIGHLRGQCVGIKWMANLYGITPLEPPK
jgi:hypothetical protein